MNDQPADNKVQEDRGSRTGLLVSLVTVVVANLVPVVGVFWFGWDAFLVILAYWLEGAVVGVFTLLKIVWALPGYRPRPGKSIRYSRKGKDASQYFTATQMSKRAIVPAFVVAYGGFMLFYGFFLMLFLGSKPTPDTLVERLSSVSTGLGVVLLCMVIEHGWSFYSDFMRGPEWARSDPVFHFWRPFGRFVLMYLLVILGGVLTLMFSLPRSFLVVFVLLKGCAELLAAVLASAGPWRRYP